MTAIQGIVAAGTVVYLTREPSWEKVILAANYLFYLAGMARRAAQVEIPYFSLAAKGIFMLTPAFLMGHFLQRKMSSPLAGSFGIHFRRFCYAVSVVSTLVLVALGHQSYGIGFFTIVVLDMLSQSQKVDALIKNFFARITILATFLSFASYGLKLATPRGHYLMLLVTAQVFFPKIRKIVQAVLSKNGSSSSSASRSKNRQRDFAAWSQQWLRKYSSYAIAPVGFFPNAPLSMGPRPTSGILQSVKNLTGDLPHNL